MREFSLTGLEVWGLLLTSLIVVLRAARKRYQSVREQYDDTAQRGS